MNQNNGFIVPEILLPRKDINLSLWSVVACDQYSSEPEYWESVSQIVGDAPSTLKLTYPEAYLDRESPAQRIDAINKNMNDYLKNGIFYNTGRGFIAVERTFSDKNKPARKGLILAVDLEKYDFEKGSASLIRATEGTIRERIPPRVAIREKAPIEFPHILILIDDRADSVMKAAAAAEKTVVYDFDLMKQSGHLTGSLISRNEDLNRICEALNALGDKDSFRNRYGSDDVLLFAVGDGNHSLATAKTLWEKRKQSLTASERESDPARFALVEINNIYDDGICFEPIHRVLFNASIEKLKDAFIRKAQASISSCRFNEKSLREFSEICPTAKQELIFFDENGCWKVEIGKPLSTITAGTVQTILDEFISENSCKIDYIHGISSTVHLGKQSGNIGLILPNIAKNQFFETVIRDGAFPRKTFSMGEADEKRFYLEGKLIQ